MSDVKVTGAHLDAACRALSGNRPQHAQEFVGSVAEAIAQAEHRVRAAVIADLRGLLERAYKGDYLNRTLVVDADSVESLIIELESQQ